MNLAINVVAATDRKDPKLTVTENNVTSSELEQALRLLEESVPAEDLAITGPGELTLALPVKRLRGTGLKIVCDTVCGIIDSLDAARV
jgi:hypothetical protein